jgi:diguanylate cyclase (GGDEF)-like protein/PAS domain S-box-containing protein
MLEIAGLSPPVILIVDDQVSNVRILREAVHGLGDVYFATDGESAVKQAEKCVPDIVLLDIEMPGMDGFAVCQAIKANPKLANAAVIFVTAHNHGEEELRALEYGGVDFLSKPLNVPIVRARIKTHIALRRETQKLAIARQDLEDVIHHLPAFVAYWHADLHCGFCNDIDGSWFGCPAAKMHGQPMQQVLGDNNYAAIEQYLPTVLDGKLISFDITLHRAAGELLHGQATLVARLDGDVCFGFLMLLVDITDRKLAESALFEEKERIRVTLNSIGDAVIATNPYGEVTFINPIAEALTGWSTRDAIGKPIELVMPLRDGSDEFDLQNPIRLALNENRGVGMALNCKLRSWDGALLDVEDSAAPIRNRDGEVSGAIVVFHDVSEARAMAIKMTHLAYHDALTDLPNRTLLQDRIVQAIQQAARNQERVAMLVLDLDNFKSINDTIGHTTGDRLLQQVAQRLLGACRSVDTVSRQGGDEFIMLLPEVVNFEMVGDIAHRVLGLISEPFWIDDKRYDLSACIGVSLYPADSEDAEALYRHADSAMHQAKQLGRNRFQFFSSDVEHEMRARHLLEQHMRQAMEEEVFEVFYQAKVDVKQQKIIGAEALIRWRKGDDLIPPVDFIPLAEETGLIIPLGKHVLWQACSDAVLWHQRGHAFTISVNISAVQFQEPGFLAMVTDILDTTGIAHEFVELEITESILAQDIQSAHEILYSLRQLGVRVAIDDFGTGYSSLSYLKRLPLDVLKIDQSFVREMLVSTSDTAIVEAIVKLGTTLALDLVAEGVENEAQMQALLNLGCHIMQGYLYSQPVPFQEMSALIEKGIAAIAGCGANA